MCCSTDSMYNESLCVLDLAAARTKEKEKLAVEEAKMTADAKEKRTKANARYTSHTNESGWRPRLAPSLLRLSLFQSLTCTLHLDSVFLSYPVWVSQYYGGDRID